MRADSKSKPPTLVDEKSPTRANDLVKKDSKLSTKDKEKKDSKVEVEKKKTKQDWLIESQFLLWKANILNYSLLII